MLYSPEEPEHNQFRITTDPGDIIEVVTTYGTVLICTANREIGLLQDTVTVTANSRMGDKLEIETSDPYEGIENIKAARVAVKRVYNRSIDKETRFVEFTGNAPEGTYPEGFDPEEYKRKYMEES